MGAAKVRRSRIKPNELRWHPNGDAPKSGEPMLPHKYKVGDVVALKPALSRNVPGGVFEVIKQLPGTGEPEYRIKSANEPYERVAPESDLSKA
jgi:hypothetical protein